MAGVVKPSRRVRLDHRTSEVVLLELSSEGVGVELAPKVQERVPLRLSAEGWPMTLLVREVV